MAYKVLVLIGDGFKQVERMFLNQGWELTNDIEEADLVQFVGGADVDPSLYNHHTHDTTSPNYDRDDKERAIYTMALDRGIPMAGICRGGQFLNVMNGGTMYQDVDNHGTGMHDAKIVGSQVHIKVTSTHHQMMYLNWHKDAEVKLLLVANESRKKIAMSTKDYGKYPVETKRTPGSAPTDIEAAFYPYTRSLCFQPHPEYEGAHVKDTLDIYFSFLEKYCFGEVVDANEVAANA